MSFDNSTLKTQINIKLKTLFVQNFMGFQLCNAKSSKKQQRNDQRFNCNDSIALLFVLTPERCSDTCPEYKRAQYQTINIWTSTLDWY